jgi:transcriptional regulator with XRE-family HTH domain
VNDPDIRRRVGAKVREARKALGLSQGDLASRIGVTRTSIANIEAGRQSISMARLLALMSVLNVNLAALIEPGDLPSAPPVPHNVVIKQVYEVTCTTCGDTVIDVTEKRGAANQARHDHIERMQQGGS